MSTTPLPSTSGLDDALAYTLRNEDSTMSGKVYITPGDKGGRTRYGLAEASHPSLTPTGFYDDMPNDQAYPLARNEYMLGYWQPMNGDAFTSKQVAIKLFDEEVNLGGRGSTTHPGALRVFQTALNACGAALTCDGVIGVNTIAAANNVPPDTLLPAFIQALHDRYNQIVKDCPDDGKFLRGWLIRADELPPADS